MKKAILKTLHYADIFDYPLTFTEIHKFLIGKQANERELMVNLRELVKSSQVVFKEDYYFLPQREELVELRQKRALYSQSKLERATKVAVYLKKVPWVEMVGITGALAMQNCDGGDDIDMMIVTSPKRLWLSRGLTVTFLRILGLYRRPNKIKNRICPNIWFSSEKLEFEDKNLFVAHEIAQIKPLWHRNKLYERFIEGNRWIYKHLPNWGVRVEVKEERPFSLSFGRIIDRLEGMAYKLQTWYMRKKITREVVEKNRIMFHPLKTKSIILGKFAKKVHFLDDLTL